MSFIFRPNPLQGAFLLKPPEGGSFAFSFPQAQFILNSNSTGATGAAGTSGVVSATFPLLYNSTTQVVSITPNYYYLNTNPSGFITSSALVPYLLSTTAASTYYPLTNPSNFITASALSGYATEVWVTGQGYITASALTPYLTSADAATTYYLQTNPSGFITSSALAGYATETWVGEQDYATNSSLANYLPLAGGTMTGIAVFSTNGTSDSEIGAWGLGVEKSDDHTQFSEVTYSDIFVSGEGGSTHLLPTGIQFPDGTTQTTAASGGDFLPLAGGTMTGNIIFGDAGQYIGKGTFDTSRGGGYGISLVCSVGYEFNWQAGWLITTEQNSTTPRPLYLDSVAGTTLRAWDSANNIGTEVSHTGITFPDSTMQTTAWTGTYNPFDQSLNTTDDVIFNGVNVNTASTDVYQLTSGGFYTVNSSASSGVITNVGGVNIFGTATLTFPDSTVQTTAWTGSYNPFDQSLNIGDAPSFSYITLTDASQNIFLNGAIQFSDTSTQTTAFPPAGGTTLQYIDGTGGLQTFPTGGAATRLETTVFNNSGVTIPKHSLVYINGRHGNDPTIALAQANSEVTSRGTFGFTTTDIADQDLGTVLQVGLLEDVNFTVSMADGALLFLDPYTAGGWTDTQPYSPFHYVNVGTAIRVHPTQGTIQVRIVNSNELSELSDVQITSAVSGDLIVKNGGGYWVSQSKATAGIAPIDSPTFTGTVTIPAGASISGFAPLASPTFTGDPKAPTPTAGDNDTSIATTAFVTTAVSALPPVIDIQTFGNAAASSTVTGTWTKPTGAKMVEIHMWGAGGGGGGGGCGDTTVARTGGGGGSAGSYSIYRVPASDLDATCAYGIPVGGAGGAGRSTAGTPSAGGNTATTNGSSYFTAKASPSTLYRTLGGIGGTITTGGGGAGGIGSLLNLAPTTTTNNGGGGTSGAGTSAGTITNGAFMGGSGGGGAGAAAASTTAANGGAGTSRNAGSNNGISTALAGGAGGIGATPVAATAGTAGDQAFASGMGGGGGYYKTGVAGGTGGAGGYPSGGGGGGGASDSGFLSGAGGKGGNGRIIVITYF